MPEGLSKFHRQMIYMTSVVPIWPQISIISQVMPEALPKFHSHDSSGYARGTTKIPQAKPINDKSCPNLNTNIHNSAGYAGGAAQIHQANTIKNKSCPNSTTNIHNYSCYLVGAAQIPHVNAINSLTPMRVWAGTKNSRPVDIVQ
jgi:hypothetical protein